MSSFSIATKPPAATVWSGGDPVLEPGEPTGALRAQSAAQIRTLEDGSLGLPALPIQALRESVGWIVRPCIQDLFSPANRIGVRVEVK